MSELGNVDLNFGSFGGPIGYKSVEAPLIKPIIEEVSVGLYYDPLETTCFPDHIIASDDCPVHVIFPNRCWYKPWTWFKKEGKFRIPNGTVIKMNIKGGELEV